MSTMVFLPIKIVHVRKGNICEKKLQVTLCFCDGNIVLLNIFQKQRTKTSSTCYMKKKVLTVRCWKSHALRMFVATLGKIPRFFWFFFPVESSSSSPVPSPLPILALLASPATVRREPRSSRAVSVINANLWQFLIPYFASICWYILTY